MGKKAVFSIKSPFGLFGIFSAAGFPFHYGNETDDAQLLLATDPASHARQGGAEISGRQLLRQGEEAG